MIDSRPSCQLNTWCHVCVCVSVCELTFLNLSQNDTNRKTRSSQLLSVSPFRFPFSPGGLLVGERRKEQPLDGDSLFLLLFLSFKLKSWTATDKYTSGQTTPKYFLEDTSDSNHLKVLCSPKPVMSPPDCWIHSRIHPCAGKAPHSHASWTSHWLCVVVVVVPPFPWRRFMDCWICLIPGKAQYLHQTFSAVHSADLWPADCLLFLQNDLIKNGWL